MPKKIHIIEDSAPISKMVRAGTAMAEIESADRLSICDLREGSVFDLVLLDLSREPSPTPSDSKKHTPSDR